MTKPFCKVVRPFYSSTRDVRWFHCSTSLPTLAVVYFFISSIPDAKCLLCGLTCFSLRTNGCQCFPHQLLAKECHTMRKRGPLLRGRSCKSSDRDIQEPEQGRSCGQESWRGDGWVGMPLLSWETWEQERCGCKPRTFLFLQKSSSIKTEEWLGTESLVHENSLKWNCCDWFLSAFYFPILILGSSITCFHS